MNKRLYSLDALKFLAAIFIFFHHFQEMYQIKFSNFNFYFGKLYFGYVVELFFILSGFFMGMKIVENKKICFGRFILNKIIRLYPMAIFSSLLFLISAGLYFVQMGRTYNGNVFDLWKILISFLQIFSGGVMDDYAVANGVTWYICVLIICYIIYWLILWLSSKLEVTPFYMFVAMALFGIAICEYGGFNIPFMYLSSGRGYESFFWGIILFYIYDRLPAKVLFATSISVFFICIITYIVNFGGFWASYPRMLVFIFYPSIIILLLKSKLLTNIFNHKIFGFLGKVSYEVFLIHYPLSILGRVIINEFSISTNFSQLDMCIFALILCVIAAIVYYCIERPITNYLISKEEKIYLYLTRKRQ